MAAPVPGQNDARHWLPGIRGCSPGGTCFRSSPGTDAADVSSDSTLCAISEPSPSGVVSAGTPCSVGAPPQPDTVAAWFPDDGKCSHTNPGNITTLIAPSSACSNFCGVYCTCSSCNSTFGSAWCQLHSTHSGTSTGAVATAVLHLWAPWGGPSRGSHCSHQPYTSPPEHTPSRPCNGKANAFSRQCWRWRWHNTASRPQAATCRVGSTGVQRLQPS